MGAVFQASSQRDDVLGCYGKRTKSRASSRDSSSLMHPLHLIRATSVSTEMNAADQCFSSNCNCRKVRKIRGASRRRRKERSQSALSFNARELLKARSAHLFSRASGGKEEPIGEYHSATDLLEFYEGRKLLWRGNFSHREWLAGTSAVMQCAASHTAQPRFCHCSSVYPARAHAALNVP